MRNEINELLHLYIMILLVGIQTPLILRDHYGAYLCVNEGRTKKRKVSVYILVVTSNQEYACLRTLVDKSVYIFGNMFIKAFKSPTTLMGHIQISSLSSLCD